jgi:hypothetical protein
MNFAFTAPSGVRGAVVAEESAEAGPSGVDSVDLNGSAWSRCSSTAGSAAALLEVPLPSLVSEPMGPKELPLLAGLTGLRCGGGVFTTTSSAPPAGGGSKTTSSAPPAGGGSMTTSSAPPAGGGGPAGG